MRPDLSDVDLIPVQPALSLPKAGVGEVAVTWVGHATFVLQIGELVVLTDPVWSSRIPGVRPRLTPPGLSWEALPRVDAVVISHNHFDHLDIATVRRLPRQTPMLVPGGLGWWFRRLGFTEVTELDWWEETTVGAVRFHFVPAHHWSRRTLFDKCQSLWGGWMLTTDGPQDAGTIYFAGDSAYGPYFQQIGARFDTIDLALLPVGAFLPRWFMKPLHMSPAEAVRSCADLGATRMVPMHWGTFALSAEKPLAPLELTRQAWEEAGRAAEDLWALAVGQTRILPARPTRAGQRAGTP